MIIGVPAQNAVALTLGAWNAFTMRNVGGVDVYGGKQSSVTPGTAGWVLHPQSTMTWTEGTEFWMIAGIYEDGAENPDGKIELLQGVSNVTDPALPSNQNQLGPLLATMTLPDQSSIVVNTLDYPYLYIVTEIVSDTGGPEPYPSTITVSTDDGTIFQCGLWATRGNGSEPVRYPHVYETPAQFDVLTITCYGPGAGTMRIYGSVQPTYGQVPWARQFVYQDGIGDSTDGGPMINGMASQAQFDPGYGRVAAALAAWPEYHGT